MSRIACAPRARLARVVGSAGLIAAVGAGLLVLPAASGATTPPVPTVTVRPATGLADGQLVWVHGSGFSAGATVALVECEAGALNESDCDLTTLQTVATDLSGGLVSPYIVSRALVVGGTSIDCAVPPGCALGSANLADVSQAASTPLRFDPSLPFAPPLQLSVAVDPTGTVKPRTGFSTLTGSLTCNRAALVELQGELKQIYLRFIFSSAFAAGVLCRPGSAVPWKAYVRASNGLFAPGHARVLGQAYVALDDSQTVVDFSGGVRLVAVT
jgi:hypothetical protein